MVLSIITDVSDFIDNIKLVFNETFSFLPTEIYTIFLVVIGLAIAIYIYRLVR